MEMHDVEETSSQTYRFSSTLVPLSAEHQEAMQLDPEREEDFTRQFVLLVAEPGFPLTSPVENPSMHVDVVFTEEEMASVEAFKQTGMYQMLFRCCPDVIWTSTFWKDATLLPCRVMPDQSWRVAWDVVELLIDSERQQDSAAFIPLVFKMSKFEEMPPPDLVQLIRKLQSYSVQESSAISAKAGWAEVNEFLKRSVLVMAKENPAVDLSIRKKAGKPRLFGSYILPTLGSPEVLKEHLTVRSILNFEMNDARLFPLSADWLLCFFLVQRCLPDLVCWIDASRLRSACGFGEDLPVASLVKNLKAHPQANRKCVALGNVLLRLITILYQWQFSDESTMSNSKAGAVLSSDSVRNLRIEERLVEKPEILEILMEWTELKGTSLPSSTQWNRCLMLEDVCVRKSKNEWVPATAPSSVGRNVKALVAACYDALGIPGVWKVCEEIGLVSLQPNKFLQKYVNAWRGDPFDPAVIQPWEKQHMDRSKTVIEPLYVEFCAAFGYEFSQKHRFYQAMHHPSILGIDTALYGWLLAIGKTFLDVFFQIYLSRTRPEMSQTTLNGVFNDLSKQGIYIDVVFSLNLHQISRTATSTIVRHLARNYRRKEMLKSDNATRNYLSSLMMEFVGCLAWDVGFDLKRVIAILEPHLSKAIENCTEEHEPKHYMVNRFVPRLLERSHFSRKGLAKMEYYPTLIQMVRKDTSEAFFGVYVLTKRPLHSFSESEMYHFVEELSLGLRWTSFSEVVQIPAEQHEVLLSFQTDWFDPLIPPENEPVSSQKQCKKYLVASAKEKEGRLASMDWELMQHVVQKTLPEEISTVLDFFTGGQVSEETCQEAAAILLSADRRLRFQEKKKEDMDRKQEALHRLVFMTELHQVVHVKKGQDFFGDIINFQCMSDVAMLPIRSRPVEKTLSFDPSSAKCLPYTLSYFQCLACVPFILDSLERRLLVEDYRQTYKLPDSIPNSALQLSLSVPSEINATDIGLLESLGHSVLDYLSTVDIIFRNPDRHVGQLSVMRTEVQNSSEMAKKEHMLLVLGHALPPFFQAYKEWYPPGDTPFTLQSIHKIESEAETAMEGSEESDSNFALVVEPVKGRVGSGIMQNVSTGVPHKHFKAIAALCFYYEGIEAACSYLYKIGAIGLSKYPSRINKQPKEQPKLKKYTQLEETLQYKFRDTKMLAYAFMHSSAFVKDGENNEILEFLGDAILDLCMWSYIYKSYPDISINQASKLKMDLTSNNLFGWISASPPLELPNLLMQAIPNFSIRLAATKRTKKDGFEDAALGKTCSDVFEALMGAILVDSGYSVETVSNVMLRLLKDALDDLSQFGIQDPLETEM